MSSFDKTLPDSTSMATASEDLLKSVAKEVEGYQWDSGNNEEEALEIARDILRLFQNYKRKK